MLQSSLVAHFKYLVCLFYIKHIKPMQRNFNEYIAIVRFRIGSIGNGEVKAAV